MDQKRIKKIKEKVEEFFEKMGFPPISLSIEPKEKTLMVNLNTEEPKLLIGEKAQTLLDIQRILRLIVFKELEEPVFIDLDINSYKAKKIAGLKELARQMADEVALKKEQKILEPMSAYERRIIHLELAERSDVTTQSIGEEPERRIVISPV